MKFKKIIIVLSVLCIMGCQKQPIQEDAEVKDDMLSIQMKINNEVVQAEFYDNETTREFFNRMPLEEKMDELNGNEMYVYLPYDLSTHKESIKSIKAGDVMLFQSQCFVIFYEDFDTSYQYTRLGHITDIDKLLKHVDHHEFVLKLERVVTNESH